jgi:hypothetical protein
MSNAKNSHWTEDENLLERYVLGRLSENERMPLEAHLQGCEQCRSAVQTERTLAAGVRRYGREQLKGRLNQRIASSMRSGRTTTTWRQILSAAAVLVIAVGIGFYNGWFSSDKMKGLSDRQRGAELKKPEAEKDQNVVERRKEDIASHVAAEADKKALGKSETTEKGRSEKLFADQSTGAGGRQTNKLDKSRVKVEPIPSAPVSGAGATTRSDSIATQSQPMPLKARSMQLWTEGTLLQGSQSKQKKQSLDAFQAPKRDQLQQLRIATEQAGRQLEPGEKGRRDEFQITQRGADRLPVERQNLQVPSAQSIQTYIEETDQGLNLTLFPDTLFDEVVLQNAKVEIIRPDSIIIEIASRKYGYRLPAWFVEKLNQKANAKLK